MPTGSLRGHLLKKCVADREAEGPPVRAVPHLALARRSSQTFCNTGLPSAGLHLCRETDIRLPLNGFALPKRRTRSLCQSISQLRIPSSSLERLPSSV